MSKSCKNQTSQKVHMMLKKTTPKMVLFFDEHARIADLFVLLITIDRRVNAKEFKQKKHRKTRPNYVLRTTQNYFGQSTLIKIISIFSLLAKPDVACRA